MGIAVEKSCDSTSAHQGLLCRFSRHCSVHQMFDNKAHKRNPTAVINFFYWYKQPWSVYTEKKKADGKVGQVFF